jgi:hypothetical protein
MLLPHHFPSFFERRQLRVAIVPSGKAGAPEAVLHEARDGFIDACCRRRHTRLKANSNVEVNNRGTGRPRTSASFAKGDGISRSSQLI